MDSTDSKIPLLEDLANLALKIGDDMGISQLEVVIQSGYTRALELKNNSIYGSQQQSSSGIGIRAYNGSKLGIASATLLNKESLEETVKAAIKLAKLAPEDDDFNSLPDPDTNKVTNTSGLFDEKIANLDPGYMIETANSMIDGVLDINDKAIAAGKVNSNFIEAIVINSQGISSIEKLTRYFAYITASIALEPTNVGSGVDYVGSRTLESFDYHALGNKAVQKAEKTLNAKVPESKKLPLLFDERSSKDTLEAIIGSGVNGFSVMTGTSYFSDKIGAEVGVEGLNVLDDPHVNGGYSSRIFDSEGVATTKIPLVEQGVLKSFVTDSYTAHKLGLQNTGNASRFGIAGKPKPSMSQIQIQEGTDSKAAMLEDLKEGLYMESGINPGRGTPNISSQADRAFYVKDGEIQYAVKNTMIASDVFSVLKNITGMSKEYLLEFGSKSPMILVSEANISGK